MTGKSPARSVEDVDATALSYAEIKALATGDDRIREKMELDVQVAKLKVLKANHTAQKYEMEDKVIQYYPREIAKEQLFIEAMSADIPIVQQHPAKDDAFSMTVQGQVYTERKAAGEAIIKVCLEIKDPDAQVDLGEYRGFPMQVTFDGSKFKVSMKQHLTYTAELSNEPVGNILRINNALEKIPADLEAHKSRHERLESEMAIAKEEAAKPFPKEEELKEKTARLSQLNKELESTPNTREAEQEQNGEAPSRPEDTRGADSGRKPSILGELRGYTSPARVAAPPDRNCPGVML